MARLEMGGAELVWESRDLPRAEWTPAGPSSYELLYRSGVGLTPRPLAPHCLGRRAQPRHAGEQGGLG